MCNVIIEAAKQEISNIAKRMHIIGTLDLIHQPACGNVPAFISGWIAGSFDVVSHKKSKKQEHRLCKVHQEKGNKHNLPILQGKH